MTEKENATPASEPVNTQDENKGREMTHAEFIDKARAEGKAKSTLRDEEVNKENYEEKKALAREGALKAINDDFDSLLVITVKRNEKTDSIEQLTGSFGNIDHLVRAMISMTDNDPDFKRSWMIQQTMKLGLKMNIPEAVMLRDLMDMKDKMSSNPSKGKDEHTVGTE